jgi:hypothetical protein
MFVVKIAEREEGDTYNKLKDAAKSFGGYWNKFTKGFTFSTREEAQKYADSVNGVDENTVNEPQEEYKPKSEQLRDDVRNAWNNLKNQGIIYDQYEVAKKHIALYKALYELAKYEIGRGVNEFSEFLSGIHKDYINYFSTKQIRDAFNQVEKTEGDFLMSEKIRNSAEELGQQILNGERTFNQTMDEVDALSIPRFTKENIKAHIGGMIDAAVEDEKVESQPETEDEGAQPEADNTQTKDEEEDDYQPEYGEEEMNEQEEDASIGKNQLDQIAMYVPASDKVLEYMSGPTIAREYGEAPLNNQDYSVNELEPALAHGRRFMEKAKEVFGANWIMGTLEYIKNNTFMPAHAKALFYVMLDNEIELALRENPTVEIARLKRYAFTQSQAFAHELAAGLNFQKLRDLGKYKMAASEVTNNIFTPDDLVKRERIIKSTEATEDATNQAADRKAEGDSVKVTEGKKASGERKKSPKKSWAAVSSKNVQLQDKMKNIVERMKKIKC